MSTEEVSRDFVLKMPQYIVNHMINTGFGIIFLLLNIPLLVTLISTSKFRTKYFMLIVLCVADSSNCLAIFLMGINRVNLYSEVISTLTIPVRTSWECAMEPWLWFRGIGDLWPPMVQVLIGLERGSAVFLPAFFRKFEGTRTRILTTFLSIIYVVGVMIFGFVMSWENREEKAKYYCGRKAGFSKEYGQYIYVSNIVCYSFSLAICGAAYIKCLKLKNPNTSNLQRVRYALFVSFCSTVLVSIPNAIALLDVYLPIADVISKPSVYASSINSGINLFIYLALNSEFRDQFVMLLGLKPTTTNTLVTAVTRSHVKTTSNVH